MPCRVSIGMPIYNGEKYLAAAVESILAQTYLDFELILADNGSTDNTQAICRDFAKRDARVHYYRNPTNLGAAPNFNRTFALATGEYFKWAACDDLITPEFVAKCVELLDQLPHIVLCFPATNIIDAEGKLLGQHTFKAAANSPQPHIRFRNLVLNPDTAFQVFGLMRRAVAGKTALIGTYPASDLVLLAELALQGEFYQIPEPLFLSRTHPEQSTRGVYKVERDRVLWFDTSLKDKVLLPKWLYLRGYLRAINRAALNPYERYYCRLQIVRWALMPDHTRALIKDLFIAGQHLAMQRAQHCQRRATINPAGKTGGR